MGFDSTPRGSVYSTGTKNCPRCGHPLRRCQCSKQETTPSGDGIVRVSREIKGRKGKGVTLVVGIPLGGDELKKLAKELRQKCGSGGTLKDGRVEIQGDHRDRIVELLEKKGFRVKRAGG